MPVQVIGEALVRIRALTDGVEQEIADPLVKGARSAASGMAAAFATAKIGEFIGESISAASDLNESISKTSQVFGESSASIHAWAEGSAEDFGLSRQAAEESVSTFGNMFTQMGIGVGAAADMSEKMVELAADFASFHNADITDVIAAQSAAFRGEYDSVQRFVPTINAAAVEQYALAHGLLNASGELTNQSRALAVNALLTEGAGKAAGDFDKTSDGLANRQRILTAEMANLRTEVGSALLPAMELLTGAATATIGAFSSLPAPVQTGIAVLGGLAAASVAVAKGIEVAQSVMATLGPIVSSVATATGLKTAATVADTAATGASVVATSAKATADGAGAIAAFAAANALELEAIAAGQSAVAEGGAAVAASSLAVANTAVAETGVAAGAGMTAALGPLGLVVGAATLVAGAFFLMSRRHDEVAEAAGRVSNALFDETGKMNLTADAANRYIAETSRFNTRNQIADIDKLGLTFAQLQHELESGTAGLNDFLASAVGHGEVKDITADIGDMSNQQKAAEQATGKLIEVNGRWYRGNADLVRSFVEEQKGLQAAAEEKTRDLRLNGLVAQSAIDLAVANNKAADGTVDWIAVNKQLTVSLASQAKVTGVVADSSVDAVAAIAGMDKKTAELAATALFSLGALGSMAQYIDRAGQAAATFGEGLGRTLGAVGDAASASHDFNEAMDTTNKTISGGGGAAAKDYEKQARDIEKANQDMVDAEEELQDALLKRFLIQLGPDQNAIKIAEIDERARKRDLKNATKEVQDAEEALQAAQKNSTAEAIAKAVAAQERNVAAAKRDVERAELAVKDAADRLNKAREEGDPDKIRKAELDLADAQDNVADKSDAASKAQDGLRDAQKLGKDAAEKIDEAQDHVAEAHDDVTLAGIKAKDAEKELMDKRNAGLPGSKEWEDANKAVKDAELKVRDAAQEVKDREAELTTGRTSGGGIQAAKDVAGALVDIFSAGSDYIQFLKDTNAPASAYDEALKKIKEKLDATAKDQPGQAVVAQQYFDTIRAAADLAKLSADDVAKASAAAVLGFSDEIPDAIAELNRKIRAGELAVDPIKIILQTLTAGQDTSGIQGYASGGYHPGGFALVGEQGPELAYFSGPTNIATAAQTQAILGQQQMTPIMLNVYVTASPGMTGTEAKRIGNDVGAGAAATLMARRLAVEVRR